MWSNYALALYRTLSRHRLYAALNTLGLALGLAVCLILSLVVVFETSFDRWIPDAPSIYRVNIVQTMPGRPPREEPSTQAVLLPALRAEFPQIQAATRLMDDNDIVRSGPRQAYERVVFADPTVFQVFKLRFLEGDPSTALADDSSLVVNQTIARKYFGTDHALGRRLTLVVDGVARDYRVSGVMADLPANTHLVMNMAARFDPEIFPKRKIFFDRWGSATSYTYVRLHAPADAQAIEARRPALIKRWVTRDFPQPADKYLGYKLRPLTSLHFADAKTSGAFKPGADPLFVAALGAMGVVTLLVAVVNYVSLATARAGMRAREVAVRKVMGATRRMLVLQFTAESVFMALGAGLAAAALTELALPMVSAMLGEPIHMTYGGPQGVLLPLIALCLAVGALSGLYPAIVLSGFRPATVLASARTPGGGRAGARVREALAIFQFGIAITLMACTAIVFSQIQFLRNADLGFRRDGLLIVEGLGEQQVAPQAEALVDQFRRVPGVLSATASDRRPATDSENDGTVRRADNPAIEPTVTMEWIGPDYVPTYGLTLAAGRALGSTQRLDDWGLAPRLTPEDRPAAANVMINEKAARALGFADPAKAVGAQLKMGGVSSSMVMLTVVGVVKDVKFLSPRTPAPPQIYLQDSRLALPHLPNEWNAAVRVREADLPLVKARLAAVWRAMEPGAPFQVDTVASAMKPYYDPDARRGQLFAAGAVLSGVIACLGLYGLAAFNTTRRFKEIGIRKTLGASTADVMRLLIGEFLRPVLWANLIAWPIAFFLMRAWLLGFDQRIDLNPIFFLAPSLAAVVVAVITVAEQTFKVARAEPAAALRYE